MTIDENDRTEVQASTLLAQIESGVAPTILDVRSRAEFARGHVPGALHVPFWLMPWRLQSVPGSPEQPVVVYCGHGPRAWFAGGVLRRHGFTRVRYLAGHFHTWRAAGRAEEK